MKRINQSSLIPALLIGLICLANGQTATADWSYHVDYFRVDGNLPAGLQEDFNGATLGPLWKIDDGTATQGGGVVRLQSPGVVDILGGVLREEESGIDTFDNNEFHISVGSGDATATSRWVSPIIPAINQAYEMSPEFGFHDGSPVEREVDFFVGIVNVDTTTAAALSSWLGVAVPTGLSGYFMRTTDREDTGVETINVQIASIDPSWFSDSVMLNIFYDDADSEISASISFDEGVTNWEPFEEYEIAIPGLNTDSMDLKFEDWNLSAKSFTVVPLPPTIWLFGSSLAGFGFLGRYRGKRV